MMATNAVTALVMGALGAAAVILVLNQEAPRRSTPTTLAAADLVPVNGSEVGMTRETLEERMCDAPIVYNKPAKTGSTSIQTAMISWAKSSGRRGIKCSAYIAKTSMQLRECIPHDSSRCAVLATHIELDAGTRELITKRLGGDFISMTSTRAPQERLVSFYMQTKKIRSAEAQEHMGEIAAFARGMNPWDLYNYHTGEARTGRCPLDEMEKRVLVNMVKHYDIVLDMDLPDESNAILKNYDLFQLSKKRLNNRGSEKLVLNKEARLAIKKVSCVEEEMHRLFRLRMASLYEKATGEPCLSEQRNPTACF